MSEKNLTGKIVLIADGGKHLGGLLNRGFVAKETKLAIRFNNESSKRRK